MPGLQNVCCMFCGMFISVEKVQNSRSFLSLACPCSSQVCLKDVDCDPVSVSGKVVHICAKLPIKLHLCSPEAPY